ncbi:M20/M25/M40 family metallo-hydrolase [Zooshikella harenae]|uniref:M20/M25/M40 family metallo-hydrolase n=1 Tax=Zooshikella harenae TaxID=2827238 RepID=A0ABS5Z7T8_9GAMM|nr:M20/M25/M40 family metallo-hydrolase [Zooshikella harenae]MBU2710069.1 M20/M25/M40 family metallo-hydrolase [Zooshikella harenae]
MKLLPLSRVFVSSALLAAVSMSGWADDGFWITIDKETRDKIRTEMPYLLEDVDLSSLTADEAFSTSNSTVAKVSKKKIDALSQFIHLRMKRCGGFIVHDDFEQALALVKQNENTPLNDFVEPNYTIDQGEVVTALIPSVQEASLKETINSLSRFNNRYYQSDTGVEAANWIKSQWEQLANGHKNVSVKLVKHSQWQQPSVVLTWKGSELPDEVVVVGGHLDSINQSSSDKIRAKAPGADDNASGIASLTEAMRVLFASDFNPKRTIKFMGYAAEEVGLRGSGDIAAQHKQSNTNVIGVMQLDMTLFNGSRADVVFMQDNTSNELTQFTAKLAETYFPEITVGYGSCGYACSDHASWYRNGYPAVMPFEAQMRESNNNIHSTNDTLESAGGNGLHAIKFAKLATAFAVELAKSAGGSPDNPDPNTPDDGSYKLLKNGKGFCLGVNKQGGNRITASQCNNAANQKWMMDSAGRIHPKADKKQCLAMRSWFTGANMAQLSECKTTDDTQRWELVGGRLQNAEHTKFYLTHFGEKYGDWVGVWYDLSNDYQQWQWSN